MLFITKNSVKVAIISLLIFISQLAQAENYESVENLNNIVKQFITQQYPIASDESIDIKVNPSGMPFKLPVCAQSIEASLPSTANHDQINAVQLACHDLPGWQTLIPVLVQINIKVIVAKRTISQKEIIREDDLDYLAYDRNRLYAGFYKNKEDVVGKMSSQVITAGTLLTKNNTQQPIIVHKNQMVDLVARNSSIEVMMKGIAKSDGALNDTVQAYNPSSKRLLDAVVIGTNRVEVVS